MPLGEPERESLIPTYAELPLHRESKHKKNLLDMKGGPQGYRPRDKRKMERALKDPLFTRKARELNNDPTGLGKSLAEVMQDLKKAQEEEVSHFNRNLPLIKTPTKF